MAFDIDRFMNLSKAVETSDLDWEYIARVGVTDDEARVLTFMSDIETHTILYMRDLLAGHSARDLEVISFLSCWVYEETHHGRALAKFLEACGRPLPPSRYGELEKGANIAEAIEAFLSHSAAKLTPHFAAVHMIWGAINEMSAALAYTYMARFTENKELAKLLTRLAKDERRHQSFYYHQAEKRLGASWIARSLSTLALKRFWGPVGEGVGEDDTLGFTSHLIFDKEMRDAEYAYMDQQVAKLPGLEWFNLATVKLTRLANEYAEKFPDEAKRLAEVRRERKARAAARGPVVQHAAGAH